MVDQVADVPALRTNDPEGLSGRPLRVVYSFPHTLGSSGIGTTALWQVRGLIDRGLHVQLFCTSLAEPVEGAARLRQTLNLRGRRIPHRALGVGRAYRFHDGRVASALARLAGQVDVVHCWPGSCLKTMATARRLGIPALREVPSAHTAVAMRTATAAAEDIGVDLPRRHSHHLDSARLAKEKAEFAASDGLLVPSDHVYQTFVDEGIDLARLVRHQYGFDPRRFFPDPDSITRSPDRPLIALFAGRGEPNKGLHLALKAWVNSGAAFRGGRFIICGTMLPAYRAVLEPMLRQPGVEERGFEPDMPAMMRQADLLLLPTMTEGSALVTYEAQACGCVLLVSDAAGALCTDGQHGLVHRAGDVATLTRQLRQVDWDRSLLARLRAATLDHRQDLTWTTASHRLVDAYRLLVRDGEKPWRRGGRG